MPERLSSLARLLMRSFEHKRTLEAVVDLTPAGDSDTPECLSELEKLLMRSFKLKGTLDYLNEAINIQQAAVDHTLAGDPNKCERQKVLRGLFMRRLQCEEALEDLDRTIEDQQAVVNLTPSDEPKHLSQLAGFLMLRFERQGMLDDLQGAIRNQQAAVDRTPAGDSDKPERLSELVRLLMRGFEHKRTLEDLDKATKNHLTVVDLTPADDSDKPEYTIKLVRPPTCRSECQRTLDAAIKYQQAAVDLAPAGDEDNPERLDVLVNLLMRRFEGEEQLEDLDRAIRNQQAVVDVAPAGDEDQPKRLGVLGGLFIRRFERKGTPEDLDEAICIYRARMVLAPADDECSRRARLEHLERLLERRLKTVDDRNNERGSWLPSSAAVPTTLGGTKSLYETIRDKLVEDLQHLGICIKKSKRRELASTLRHMENAILCLKFQDGDQLCQDVFKASTRLGAYCQALRNRAGDETNQKELEDLYKEFVRIEREFSAAHDRINSKYEQLYKQWKAERESISKFLSKADSSMSQSNNIDIWALVEQVDAGFEKIGNVLKNEANDLKILSETVNGLSKQVHLSPDPPIPTQIPPDPASTPSEVSTQVDDMIATLSQLDALVEKSRYTKARQIISETSSKTTQKLKKLRTSSEDYDEQNLSLSCLRTRNYNDHSRDIRNRQRELCNELSNLVGGMRRMLKGIERGFSGCKASTQGLVFRPLGDFLCDLERYMPQAGLEVTSKGLHPDLILYEAAFQAIADSIPAQSMLLERIKGSLSVVDKLRGV